MRGRYPQKENDVANWRHRIALKHLMQITEEDESRETVQKSMNAIADEIEKHSCFHAFLPLDPDWRNIPAGDRHFGPVDYANQLLDEMYNFADEHDIWIE